MSVDPDILEELTNEALDSVEDQVSTLNDLLAKAMTSDFDDTMQRIKICAHSIKGVASSFEFPAIKAIAHRFEDYIFEVREFSAANLRDMQAFSDKIAEAHDARVNSKPIDVSEIMRSLPAKGGFNENDISVRDVEVMLVMEPGIATRIVTRELLECGYRMINVASTLDAFQLVPSMRPDLVIVSNVMPELSGLDLTCALRSMPVTKDIPVAMISTQSREDESLKELPDDVPILRKGARFADDVADVFVEMGIL